MRVAGILQGRLLRDSAVKIGGRRKVNVMTCTLPALQRKFNEYKAQKIYTNIELKEIKINLLY